MKNLFMKSFFFLDGRNDVKEENVAVETSVLFERKACNFFIYKMVSYY